MSNAGLFIEWGATVTGRESKALEVFGEAMNLYEHYERDGEIDSYEVVLLSPHGNGLSGYALLRGSAEQCASVRGRDDFQRVLARAGLVVDHLGVVDATLGEGIPDQMAVYTEAIGAVA
ncbi:MAG: hypothetical protein GXY03_14160 [Solirubrobacterales bacterium]|nr:hypothetical protein [Solirubrobacterales bacterium]